MLIAHNMMAMNAQRQFNIVGNSKKRSMEKLSSGYRINRAADDAAGLSISEKMRWQIRGLNKGSDNVQEGISLCQVADGALAEVDDMLHRITELSVQAANDTNTDEDRQAIQKEISHIIDEIDRISNDTEFNTKKIFSNNVDGSLGVGGDNSDITATSKVINVNVAGVPSDISETHYQFNKINDSQISLNGQILSLSDFKDSKSNSFVLSVEDVAYVKYNGLTIGLKISDKSDFLSAVDGVSFDIQVNTKAEKSLILDSVYDSKNCMSTSMTNQEKIDFWTSGLHEMEYTSTYSKNSAYFEIKNQSNGSSQKVSVNFYDSGANKDRVFVNMDGKRLMEFSVKPNTSFDEIISEIDGLSFNTQINNHYPFSNNSADFFGMEVSPTDFTKYSAGYTLCDTFGLSKKFLNELGYDLDSSFVLGEKIDVIQKTDDSIALKSKDGTKEYIFEMTQASKNMMSSLEDKCAKIGEEYKISYTYGDSVITRNVKVTTYVDCTDEGLFNFGQMVFKTPKYSINVSSRAEINDLETTSHLTTNISVNNIKIPDDKTDGSQGGQGEERDISKGLWIQSGAKANQGMFLKIDRMNTSILGINHLDVSTSIGAGNAISASQAALDKVNANRSKIGAQQNRLEHTMRNNDNTSENTQDAESKIRDTDMAMEMVEFSKQNILQQVGQSMIAQANQSNQGVISLLQ